MKRFSTILRAGVFALTTLLATAFLPETASAQRLVLPSFADLVERTGGAVVNIRTTQLASARSGPQLPDLDPNDPFFEFFRRFFPPGTIPGPGQRGQRPEGPRQEVPRGVGSGFVISDDGYLLTNHHVVDGADEIYVTLPDKREYKGRLVGSDQRTDVALVKIEAQNLKVLKIGASQELRVGDWVLAIGSPFGLDSTVTAGIVSALGRETGDYLPFIQTDVAVNPGNSGGPLINMAGEVVGINSQIYSRTGGFMGISFAIPIDEAMRVADQLRTSGRVVRGRIGVGIAEVTKDVAEPLGLDRPVGALVRSVEQGGPADRAGLQVGDIILEFDGKQIERSSDLPRIVGGTKPGSKVSIKLWRQGAARDVAVTVGEMTPERTARAGSREPSQGGPQASATWLGVAVADLGEQQREALRIRGGVLVESVAEGSPSSRAGVRPGDVILQVNNEEVRSASQFSALVAKLDREKSLVLLVRRGDAAQYLPIKP
ncbi:MAG: DegQ family serine endoprotease [Burkholderiaceae bacterium]|nr:DegQ family serine endoprotease [Burkholderiaceae bacterium]